MAQRQGPRLCRAQGSRHLRVGTEFLSPRCLSHHHRTSLQTLGSTAELTESTRSSAGRFCSGSSTSATKIGSPTERMLEVLDGLGGRRRDAQSSQNGAVRLTRQLGQRVQRREQEFDHAHSLSEQGVQNLRTLTFV